MTITKTTELTNSPAGSASLHLGQETVMLNNARFKVVACGRRWGKTELGKSIILQSAVEKNQTRLVAGADPPDGEPGLA